MFPTRFINLFVICTLIIFVYSEDYCSKHFKDCEDICGDDDVKSCSFKMIAHNGTITNTTICDGRESDRGSGVWNANESRNIECSYSTSTEGGKNNQSSIHTETRNSVITINM